VAHVLALMTDPPIRRHVLIRRHAFGIWGTLNCGWCTSALSRYSNNNGFITLNEFITLVHVV
jgi:hypothetical protein